MSFETSEADRRIANIISVGRVVAIDPGSSSAKVQIGDLTTPLIQVNALRAGVIQFWWMPSVGEQVLVAAPSGDMAQAVIVASIFAGNAPSADPNVPMINLNGGKMIIDGNLEITEDLKVSGNVLVEGTTTSTGNFETSADVTASGVSLVHHTHPGILQGGSSTGEPNHE